MLTINEPTTTRLKIKDYQNQSKIVALVPTMGNLHKGHLSLIKIAKQYADIVVVSIFVNPMQFGENEDFGTYPRTLSEDTQQLEQAGVNLLFTPKNELIYPLGSDKSTKITVPNLSHIFCGKFRPQFFIGVASVVAKLFNILPCDIAVFGKKDYQQLLVIKQMVADLSFPIKILSGETIREPDGLALSSRNNYLTEIERKTAINLQLSLQTAKCQILDGKNFKEVEQEAINRLTNLGFKVDYFNAVDSELNISKQPKIIIAAAWLGKTRLIDNIEIGS